MPLKSGGAVDNEYTRGRSNLGLMSSGKGIVCPSGEQMTNGDFEKGDFTGFTISGAPTVDTWNPHSGTYHCAFWSVDDSVKQDIQSLKGYVVPVICIAAFEVWLYGTHCPHADVDVIITYSDDSTTTVNFTDLDDTWHQCDILPYLDTTKSVKSIEIKNACVLGGICLDDVSLSC